MYHLDQTPVPVWAVPDRRPIQLDLEAVPNYFLSEAAAKQDAAKQDSASVHSHHGGGWWNTMADASQRKEDVDVDPNLLTAYDLDSRWENRMEEKPEPAKGLINLDKIRDNFLKNLSSSPFYPIAMRGSSWMFSVITLGLSAAVFVQSKKRKGVDDTLIYDGLSPTASTKFTIIMSTISTVYLAYSLWDETFGQPLGLRRSTSKVKFVALDLALLCLNAASVALAFETMVSRLEICPGSQNPRLCKLHKAVVSFTLVTLVTWCLTFLVSTFRMIDRATH